MPALDFASLIDPVTPDGFADEYWERRPLVVERNEARHFGGLLTLDGVEDLIGSGRLRYPECRLIKAGADLAPAAYVEPEAGTIQTERLHAELSEGATIVLSGLERHAGALWRLCRSVESFLSQPVQANAYLTPAGAQGFDAHFDTHDVFVLQIAGAKHWRVYEGSVHLPENDQHYETRVDKPGELVGAYDFRPGTVAYLPRGFVHEAVAADATALHITLGVPVTTWGSLFAEVLGERRVEDEAFRKALPIGFARGEGDPGAIEAEARRLVGELGRPERIEDVLRLLRARLLSGRAPLMDD